MKSNTCCFFGHRRIDETEELKAKILDAVERLITGEGVDTFLFGSKSRFDSLCLEAVSLIKQKYPHIKRVYVRAEYPVISDSYKSYLLKYYDDTYYPEKLLGAGRAIYVERNRIMIDQSQFCIIYFDEAYSPAVRKSGTKLALDYATKKQRKIILPYLRHPYGSSHQ